MKQYSFDKSAFLHDLNGLASINATNGDCGAVSETAQLGQGVCDSIDYLLDLARSYGFRTKNLDGCCGWAEMGEGDEMVAILVHVDTVPVETQGWIAPPFSATVVEDKIYGRGVGDDKGPAMLSLYAMKAVADSKENLGKRVRLIIGGDEEGGAWRCMNRYRATEETPSCAFTPDSTYPVTYAEKGIVHLCFSRPLGADVTPIEFSSGVATNVVPAQAAALVGGKRYEAHGKAAHAMEPHQGENALLKLCAQLREMGLSHPFLSLAERLTPQGLQIAFSDEPSGELTINPAIATVTADHAMVKCDLRVPVTYTDQQVKDAAAIVAAQFGFAVEVTHYSKPLHVAKNSPLVCALQAVYRDCTGREDPPVSTGGGTYARAFDNAVAFGALFPEENGDFHQTNEHWNLASLEPNFQIFCNAIAALAK